jgi:hypothetical protein
MDLFEIETKPLEQNDIDEYVKKQKALHEVTQKIKAHLSLIQTLSVVTKSIYVQNTLNKKK